MSRSKALTWLAAFLWGTQYSIVVPAIGFLLATLYDAPPGQVGWMISLYSAAGFVATLVIPGWADRRATYVRWMQVAAACSAIMAALMWVSSSVWVGLVALLLFGAPAGVGNSLFFAHLRHAGASARDVINTRAVISFAWVAGPPAATFLVSLWGARALLPAIMALSVSIMAVGAAIGSASARGELTGTPEDREADEVGALSKAHIGVVVLAFSLLQATNAAMLAVLVLFVTDYLGLPVVWAGVAMAVAAGLEVPMLMLSGRLTTRFGKLTLIASCCVAGALFYSLLPLARGVVPLVLLQVINAWFFAVIAGTGLSFFQEVIPRPGLASGMYANTRRIGQFISGPVIALAGIASVGYGGMFLACAVICLVSMALVLWVGRASSGHQATSAEVGSSAD